MGNKEVTIIVVWYNPTERQISLFVEISKYYHVIAVDNSIEEQRFERTTGSLDYLPLHGNAGIAKAQNVGIDKAKELGFNYVIFFDQDTTPVSKDIQQLYEDYINVKITDATIAAIGPCLINKHTGEEYANYRQKQCRKFQKVEMLMSTSTLTDMQSLEAIGYMDESLFIDFVDHEWCWRATHSGYSIYQTENVKISHSVGKKVIKFFGYERPISSPQRYFYQFRNSLWLMHYDCPPSGWKLRVIPRLLLEFFFIMIYNRSALPFAIKGILEGIRYKNHI